MINHITGLTDPTDGILALHNLTSYPEMYGLVFTNNIVTTGKYPGWNTGDGVESCAYANVPLTSLKSCFASFTFTNRALITDPSHYPPSSWPDGNLYAEDIETSVFNLVRASEEPTNSNRPVPKRTVARSVRISGLTLLD